MKIENHNDCSVIGRICDNTKIVDYKNKKAVEVKVAIPNDEDYDLNPNIIYAYIYSNNNFLNNMQGVAIAIDGHLESDNKLIVDVFSLLKEK